MTSQWPQTASFWLLILCSLLLDLSSTGLIKDRGTKCFISRKREPLPTKPQKAEFEVTSFLIRFLGLWSRKGEPYTNDLYQPWFEVTFFLIWVLLHWSRRRYTLFLKTKFPLGRTSQKFKPNPNEIFLLSKNILAWVRFEFLGNQAFTRGCGGDRVSEQNLVRLGQVVRSIWNLYWKYKLPYSWPES